LSEAGVSKIRKNRGIDTMSTQGTLLELSERHQLKELTQWHDGLIHRKVVGDIITNFSIGNFLSNNLKLQ
jgi:hypothetical protein